MMCTYFSKEERQRYLKVEDKNLNEIFQEVIEIFGDKFFVTEHNYLERKNFFSKYEVKTQYSVYSVINDGEAQCLNFLTEKEGVNKPIVFSFFMGLLAGSKFGKK